MVKNRRLFTAGKRLRALRELMGLSRPQFAELVGMTAKRLENIENELQRMHDEDFEKVCGTFPEFSDWIAYEGSIEPQSIAWKVADSAQAAAVYLVERNPVLLEQHGIDMQAWRERQDNLDDSRLDALLGLSEEQATQWREQLQRLQEEITRQQTLEAERQAQLLQHRRQRPETDREALEDNLRQQRERLAASEQAYLDTYSQLQADNQRREQSQALLAELERARAEFRRWGRLNELIGSSSGDKFRRIAQGYNLDLLVQHSNVQLRQLARRYRLQRGGSELGLLVVDTEMGDELRSVYSLSGGETFLISLALALGLASMASSKLRIESLFIDEGFGSLDPESLQLAMDALDNLQAQGRKVAVISHVQEMHERIPVQVRVQREGNGMSSLKVVG